jgi:aminopeptidase N
MLLSLWKEAQRVIGANDQRPIVWRDYEQPMQQFDTRAYPKGAWVLHMIRSRLGVPLYRAGVRFYLAHHRDSVVTTDDLQEAFETVSGRSFDQFFDQWVYHGGVPVLDIDYSWDAEKKTARVSVKQAQKTDGGTPVFAFPLPVRFIVTGEDGREVTEEFTASVSKAQEDFHWPLKGQPVLVRVDPELTVLAKVNFTPSGEMLDRQLRSDFLGRMTAVQALANQKTDAAVAKLAEAASGDAHWAIRAEAAGALGKISAASARAALISLTSQPDERVRHAVVQSLGAIYHSEARTTLAQLAASESNPLILASIIEALAAWPEADLVSFLAKPSYHGMTASAAIRALRARHQQSSVPAIVEAVKQQPFPPRELGSALRALGALARGSTDDTVRDFLTGYLLAPHDAVRTGAVDALGELGDPRALPALQKLAAQSRNPSAPAAQSAAAKIQSRETPQPQAVEAWKKVDALQRRIEELEKKLPPEKPGEKK